jgi:hypothetical protein
MIKSRMMRCAVHVARIKRLEMRTNFLLENLNGRDHSEDLGIDGKIILKLILRKLSGRMWTSLILLRIGVGGGLWWTR